jgi:hypothetical protein
LLKAFSFRISTPYDFCEVNPGPGEFRLENLGVAVCHCHLRSHGPNSERDKSTGGVVMLARIYKPAKTAMQSGRAKTIEWVLEYEPATPREIDPLMGWTSSNDMLSQVRLFFDTKEEAIDYAQKNGIPFRVFEPHPRGFIKKSYADNFKFGRIGSWTH